MQKAAEQSKWSNVSAMWLQSRACVTSSDRTPTLLVTEAGLNSRWLVMSKGFVPLRAPPPLSAGSLLAKNRKWLYSPTSCSHREQGCLLATPLYPINASHFLSWSLPGGREGGLTIVFCTGNMTLGSMIETSRWGSCLVVFLATFFQLSIFNFQAGGSEKHPVKQSSPKMLVLPPLRG